VKRKVNISPKAIAKQRKRDCLEEIIGKALDGLGLLLRIEDSEAAARIEAGSPILSDWLIERIAHIREERDARYESRAL
jgi:hypothetical protein